MNSTFQAKLADRQPDNFRHYTYPPPLKPKRTQVSRGREAIPEKCPLPDLVPNSLFDELDDAQIQPMIPGSTHATSLNDAREISSPSTPDAALLNLNLIAEKPGCEAMTEKSVLGEVEIEDSQQSTSGRTLYSDGVVLDQRNPSRSASIPVAASNLDAGVDNSSPSSAGDVHNDNTSTGSTQADDDRGCHGRAEQQEPERQELGSPYDDIIPSVPEIRDPKFGNTAGNTWSEKSHLEPRQGALQSAEPGPRVVIPTSRAPLGQPSLKAVSPYPAATIKAPRFPAGVTSRPLSHKIVHPPPRAKRRASTMAGQLNIRHRRLRTTNRARASPDAWPSDSDSDSSYDGEDNLDAAKDARPRPRQRQRAPRLSGISKSAATPKWKSRSGGRTSSVSTRSQSGVLFRGVEDSPRANTALGVLCDAGVAATLGLSMLPNPNIPPVTSTEVAVLTVLLADITEIGALLESPAACGLTGAPFSTARLVHATVKPHPSQQWQVTVTFSSAPSVVQTAKNPGLDTEAYTSSADSVGSSSSIHSVHHYSSEDESGSRTRGRKRGRWEEEDDENLIAWRRLGKPWSWIYKKFPDRSEGAIKSRWYVVLAPRQKPKRS
ncbi:uncharacterized protein Z519_12810 [Cladophialophora bantiana CBS 173.52]|uniref:Myb-like domain-containing protein n=1 Tax=Cladophialophora bantiana (strain ATCC 10958 / CBS 173.52 / CDC B-1940 / NIH 8579) TaxID=1442370 RepID=A0A0D2HQ57_CLAB1|nr:uncharacterized protein Z519_12810 [Cladophialophora bantiana CBS 173.52]KIW86579.1 hypothetical protein Z519_12810 [Cladophialophora bantiana CBS 173.52]